MKTTLIAFAAALIMAVTFGGTANASGHCTLTPETLIERLTSADEGYGEVLIATGESEAGTFSFYGEPFGEEAGGVLSPTTRTFSLLRDGWDADENVDPSIQCTFVWGSNLRIVADSQKQTYNKGLVSVMFVQRNNTTALIILHNPDTNDWKIMQVNGMGTTAMNVVVVAFGTDFVLLVDQDPEPEPEAAPEPESEVPWNG